MSEAGSAGCELVEGLKRLGQEALERAREVLRSGQWRLESRTADGDELHSCKIPNIGRVLMITAYFDCTGRALKELLIDRFHEYPEWSDSYIKGSCKTIMSVNDHMDLTHMVTRPRLGGLVTARDWLSVRHWRPMTDENGTPELFSAAVAASHPDYPPGKGGITRAETLVSAYAIADVPPSALPPDAAGAARCRLRFLACARLGGWLPQSVVERYFHGGLVEFVREARLRLAASPPPSSPPSGIA